MFHRKWLITLCAAALLVNGVGAGGQKPGPAAVDVMTLDRAVYDGLRDVINHGARVFNDQGDYHGCARIFQGGLLAVRPLLAHRPDVQKFIDEGLAKTNDVARVVDRAFALRQVLDEVRERIRTPASAIEPKKKPEIPEKLLPPKEPEKKPIKPPETKKPAEKKPPPSLEATGIVHGKVTLAGKPLGTGYITFVDKAANRTFSTYLRVDGDYRFRHALPPGRYMVYFGPAPTEPGAPVKAFDVPPQYLNPATSAVIAEVRAGDNMFNIDLPSKLKP